MAKTLLAMRFLSANLLHFPHGPAHARRLVEALFAKPSASSCEVMPRARETRLRESLLCGVHGGWGLVVVCKRAPYSHRPATLHSSSCHTLAESSSSL